MEIIVTILIILVIVGTIASKRHDEATQKMIVRSYKHRGQMERDLNRMYDKGFSADHTTAVPGFITGTRSYSVIYRKR